MPASYRFRAVSLSSALVTAMAVVGIAPEALAARPKCFGEPATLVGGGADDELVGTRKRDVIVGRGGADFIVGRGGNDLICGGGGDDLLTGGGGDDRISGGKGGDFLFTLDPTTGITIDLGAGTMTGQGSDRLKSIEYADGTEFADRMAGSDGFNILFGEGGDDIIDGGVGVDIVTGDAGNDQLYGGESFDFVVFSAAPGPVTVDLGAGTASGEGDDGVSGFESVMGSTFNDSLTGDAGANYFLGIEGDDAIDGAGGLDSAVFWFATAAVRVDLAAGSATGDGSDTLANIESLFGSEGFDDVLIGDDANNYLDGDAGNDQLFGGGGEDWFVGGPGNDAIDGGPGGYDLADFYATVPLTADLGAGTATGEGSDTLTGIEALYGTEYDDVLIGDGGINYLFGWFGNDQLSGAAGDDFIDGQDGSDSADGGDGNDNCVSAETAAISCEGTLAAPPHPLAAFSSEAAEARAYRPPRQ